MIEKPILFSAPMVWALLDGSKTQTRRVVKRFEVRDGMPEPEWASLLRCCPYGQPDDRLIVDGSITLEIVSIRVERLQDITEEDAIAEGVQCASHIDYRSATTEDGKELHSHAVDMFRELWESINGKGSWGENPCVWVIEFKRVAQ